VNDAYEIQEAPLLFAARSGHLNALLKLLHLDADPKATNWTDDTTLHWLCSFSDTDVKDTLVCAGADIDAQAKTYPDEQGLTLGRDRLCRRNSPSPGRCKKQSSGGQDTI